MSESGKRGGKRRVKDSGDSNVVLVGSYRPDQLKWIEASKLFALPIYADEDDCRAFTHCQLTADGCSPFTCEIHFDHIADAHWLKQHKCPLPTDASATAYAIYDCSKQLADLSSLRKAKRIDIATRVADIPFPGPKNPKFTFIDLFAGIGGVRMGFQDAGNACVFSAEWDEQAQKTYKRNYGGEVAGDVTEIDPAAIQPFDILCGGFPCQPFSSIGKRQGFQHPTQGTLFFYIKEILRVRKPKAFFLENVPGLMTHDNGNTYKVIMQTLSEELGYETWSGVLDAADYGVPQRRKRLYFVGYLKNLKLRFVPPKGDFKGRHVGIGRFLERDVSGYGITKHLQEKYIFKKDDGHPEIVDETSDFPVKTLCASYHKIQRITGTFVRDGDTGLRLLTANECKAIQGFPPEFVVPVSRTSMHHQFGNSVAVPVIRAIANVMTQQLLTVKEANNG